MCKKWKMKRKTFVATEFSLLAVFVYFFFKFFFSNLQGKKIEEFNKITLSIWAK